MSWATRITQPGFDVFTDTNPDHFSLLTDNTNILIKEFVRGSATIATNATQTIAHNLGYIPFFLVFANDNNFNGHNNFWSLVQWGTISASVPPYAAAADTTNLYIKNYQAVSITFKYYIFYDFVISGSAPAFTNTGMEMALTQPGFNVLTDTDPNDYIFHSNLNTFKIIKEANVSINYTANAEYSFAHGSPLANTSSHMLFVKFPTDGIVASLCGFGAQYSKDNLWFIDNVYMDATNFYMTINGPGGSHTINLKYYIFETPL